MTKILVAMLGVAALSYTLFILWMTLFTLAFFGLDTKGSAGGILMFGLIALSPIPVCRYCFGRAKMLLNGERPRI